MILLETFHDHHVIAIDKTKIEHEKKNVEKYTKYSFTRYIFFLLHFIDFKNDTVRDGLRL